MTVYFTALGILLVFTALCVVWRVAQASCRIQLWNSVNDCRESSA